MLLEVMRLLRGPAAESMTLADCQHVTVSFMAAVCMVRPRPALLGRQCGVTAQLIDLNHNTASGL